MTHDRDINEKIFGSGQRHMATSPLAARLISLAGSPSEEMAEQIPREALDAGKIELIYTNHRGETGVRSITPLRIIYGHSEYHPDDQWLLDCFDHDKKAVRTYALAFCDFTYP